jgi:hypothetical protein
MIEREWECSLCGEGWRSDADPWTFRPDLSEDLPDRRRVAHLTCAAQVEVTPDAVIFHGPLTLQTWPTPTLLVNSRRSISHAMRMRFSRGMY